MRQSINFDWSYKDDFDESYLKKLPDDKTIINIPHNIKDVPYNYFDENNYQKIVTYEKVFDVEENIKGKSILLKFEGFMLKADIYLNDKSLGRFISGYLPVSIDITNYIKQKSNRLTVVLDSHEDKEIPPFGFAVDYLTFSGIYREVGLEVHEKTYLDNIFVNANHLGEVNISYDVFGDDKFDITYRVLDKEKVIFESKDKKFTVKEFNLWNIDNPYLYTLEIEATFLGKNEVYKTRFGFKTAVFTNEGFYLNNERIQLIGLNRHQLYPYVGAAMPKRLQIEDADLLKKMGANVVRCSHYPQSEHFLNRCDEIGLLVVTEIPGWQHIGKEETWRNNFYDLTKRMVVKERVHTSLVAIGVRIDESIDDHELYEKANRIAHELDPYHQTIGVRNTKNSELLEDIYGYNDFVCDSLKCGVINPKKACKVDSPYLITEYMGHMDPLKATSDIEKAQEVTLRHLKVINDSRKYERISGCIGWCFVDYYTHVDFGSGDHICTHGVYDMFRNRKNSSYAYSSQQEKEPFLEVLSNMKPGDFPTASYQEINVLTNCDYIKLFKNGKFVKTFYPTKTKVFDTLKHPPIVIDDLMGETFSDERFSKKECSKIAKIYSYGGIYGFNKLTLSMKLYIARLTLKYHLTWDDLLVIWNTHVATWGGYAKEFTFVGFKDDKEVIKRTISPNKEFMYEVDVKDNVLVNSETYDVLPIRIAYKDKYGQIMNYAKRELKVVTEGPVDLIGSDVQSLIGGQITIYIKSKNEKGKAKVRFVFDSEIKELEFEVK